MLYSLVTYVTKNGIGEYVIIRRIDKGLFMSESVLSFLEEKNLPEVIKKKHTYLMMDGHDQEDIYVLKDGVVKVSIVLCDGREFNITYLKGLDIISLLKDEINKMTTASFHARIESDTASFYRINRKFFEQYVKENEELHAYIESYYRKKMTEAIYRQQLMTMNGKNGAVCAFIYHLIPLFGRQVKKGIFIDLQITNDDIASFCGVSTRNSVNRILRGLREENVITMVYHKILILDVDYLKRYAQ
jgi:CRP-like cAMP-binding protein